MPPPFNIQAKQAVTHYEPITAHVRHSKGSSLIRADTGLGLARDSFEMREGTWRGDVDSGHNRT